MKWYERVASDPKGSLERLAARQDLSVDELQARHRRIATVLGGEEAALHLGASDWRLFRSAPDQLSETKRAHLDGCAFCQRLGNAFTSEAIAGRTRRTADAADGWDVEGHGPEPVMQGFHSGGGVSGTDGALDASPRWFRSAMVLPMLAVALVTALVTTGVTTSLRTPMNAPTSRMDATALLAVGSVILPKESRPASPVALLSTSEGHDLEDVACAPSTWTVSEVTRSSLQLTWESQSDEELTQGCRAHNEDTAQALSEMIRRAESASLSVGQNVVVVSPAMAN